MILTITEKAGAGALVQSNQTQVLHNPHSRAARSSVDRLGNLTLHLEPDLDNFQRICEDLGLELAKACQRKGGTVLKLTT